MLIKFNIVEAKSDETETAAAWLICIYLSSIDPDKKNLPEPISVKQCDCFSSMNPNLNWSNVRNMTSCLKMATN